MRHPLKAVLVTVISVIAALFALAERAPVETDEAERRFIERRLAELS